MAMRGFYSLDSVAAAAAPPPLPIALRIAKPALRLLALLLLLAGALLRRGDYARLGLSLLLLLEQQRVSETLSRLRGGGTALPSRLPRASPPRAASLRGLPWRRKFG
mmetsp:Transcript_17507/g.54599  ORF Transcript_17507/g.54599 Transcript_17507/m.54599 type:complete len:107 (+) Transcript_17507:359-679(+)